MPKAIKYIAYIFATLLLIVMLALAATQTGPFRRFVRNKVVSIANEQINGTLAIDAIKGTFFSSLELSGVSVTGPSGDTVAAFDRLAVNYSLLPLLTGTIEIQTALLQSPLVNLEQKADSSWNFQALLPGPKIPDTTAQKPFGLTIRLGKFKLNEGRININMPDTMIPGSISNLYLEVDGRYSSSRIKANLSELKFKSPPQLPDLEHLQVSVTNEDSLWTVRDLVLVTPENELKIDGKFKNLKNFTASLTTQNLHINEFDYYIPEFNLGVNPNINFDASAQSDDLSLQLKINQQDESVDLSGEVTRFSDLLNEATRSNALVDLLLKFKNFRPAKWLVLENMPAVVNGELTLKGNGLSPDAPLLIVDAKLSESEWEPYEFSKLTATVEYLAGQTKAEVQLNMGDGALLVRTATNLADSLSLFTAEVESNNFPAHRFLPQWGDSTFLTFNLAANGNGLLSQSPQARFQLNMHQSSAAHVPIDTLLLRGNYKDKGIILDTLKLTNTSVRLTAQGQMRTSGVVSATLDAKFRNLNAFKYYVNLPASWDSLKVMATAKGTTDSLLVNLKTTAGQIQYDSIAQMERLQLTADGTITPDGFSGDAILYANNAIVVQQNVDSLRLSATLAARGWEARLQSFFAGNVQFITEAQGNLGTPLVIHVSRLELQHPNEQFSLMRPGADLTFDSTQIKVENFDLAEASDSLFRFKADGIYKTGKSIDADVSITHLELSSINRLGFLQTPLEGILNFGMKAGGPLSEPNLRLTSNIKDLKWSHLNISDINLKFSHLKDSVHLYLTLHGSPDDSLVLRANAPVHINLADSQMVSSIKEVDARLLAKDFKPDAFFDAATRQGQYVKGLLNTDVKISGNITSPNLGGFIHLAGGEVSIPSYGIKYSDLILSTTLHNKQVVLDSLYAATKTGNLLVTGEMAFDSTIVSGKVSTMRAQIKANDFQVSRHQNHELQIDANIQLEDSARLVNFGGDLTIESSSFYLPGLLNMGGDKVKNSPLLVQALEEEPLDSTYTAADDSLTRTPADTLSLTAVQSNIELVENMTGKLSIEIPRNTWVRSEEMNVELYGDIDLLKNNEYFELFGSVGINRGYYTLYGRKLIIQEGQITFQGGREYNPNIDLKAVYNFRGADKQKNELLMIARGTLMEPELSFELNNQSITERDAMAYLIFNKSFDELSFSNQEGVSGNVPSAVLSSLLSSQITKIAGDTFNLDMVEIKANEDWESASFMVGKYITNDLFVTYQRGFGENKDESFTPQVITLEYELSRHIFLRLTQGEVKDSGIDVIFKFEK